MKYDFRKNSQTYFEASDITEDTVLSHVAQMLKVEDGPLEVEAENAADAFKLFFGVDPEDSVNLPEEKCPGLYESDNGFYDEHYEITPETSW